MTIEDMSIKQFRELQTILRSSTPDDSHWHVGEAYFMRTVTHHLTGRLIKVTRNELVLIDAAWIASDGRFADAIEHGTLDEVEPYPAGEEVIVGRGSLIDAVRWRHPLPRDRK